MMVGIPVVITCANFGDNQLPASGWYRDAISSSS